MKRFTILMLGLCGLACSTEDRGGDVVAGNCAYAAPECFDACGSSTQIPATCGPLGWECTGGVALDDCQCEGEPTPCVDVCGGEAYEADCQDGVWSCGTGVAADECLTCSGSPGVCVEACGSEIELAEAVCEGNLWR